MILKRTSCFLLIFILIQIVAFGQDHVKWSFKTTGKIHASPVVFKNYVYIGSDDGKLYCLDKQTGELVWNFDTEHPIRSKPRIAKDLVLFQSGNVFYALNTESGELIWKHEPEEVLVKPPVSAQDHWDYHHSSAFVAEESLYYGNEYGRLYGLTIKKGKEFFSYKTSTETAIRATPAIDDQILYFGDWSGYIYAIHIKDSLLIWKEKTFDKKEYPTFGPIVSEVVVEGNQVYFGARNYNFQVYDKRDGKLVWVFNHPGGGWISGTPVISGNRVYVGGSDSNKMHVLNCSDGKVVWEYQFTHNVFSKPALYNDLLIFTEGDAYAVGEDIGEGHLHILKSDNGELIKKVTIPGNVFSDPVIDNNSVFVGSFDGSLYCYDLNELLK